MYKTAKDEFKQKSDQIAEIRKLDYSPGTNSIGEQSNVADSMVDLTNALQDQKQFTDDPTSFYNFEKSGRIPSGIIPNGI